MSTLKADKIEGVTNVNVVEIPIGVTGKYLIDLTDGGYDVALKPLDLITKGPWVDARAYGTLGTQAAIVAALADIGSDERTLYLAPGTWSITSNLATLANVNLKMERGAVLAIATGVTVTINGSLEAGLYQVFSCTGTGKVDFSGATGMAPAPVEWWGAVGDGSTDCTAAIQKAGASKANLKFGKGDYWVSTHVPLYSGQCVYGDGVDSKITYTGDGVATTPDFDGAIIAIQGGLAAAGGGHPVETGDYSENNIISGLHLVGQGVNNENGVGMTYAKNTIVTNCFFTNMGQAAWTAQWYVYNNTFKDSHIISAGVFNGDNAVAFSLEGDPALATGEDCTGNVIDNIAVESITKYGMRISYANKNIISNINFNDSCSDRLIIVTYSNDNNISNINQYGIATGLADNAAIDITASTRNTVEHVRFITSNNLGRIIGIDSTSTYNVVNDVRFITSVGSAIFLRGQYNKISKVSGIVTGNYWVSMDNVSAAYNTIDNCEAVCTTNVNTVRVIYQTGGAATSLYNVFRNINISCPALGMAVYAEGCSQIFDAVNCLTVGSTGGLVLTAKYNTIINCFMDGVAAYGFYVVDTDNMLSNNRVTAVTGTYSIVAGQTSVLGNSWQPRTGAASPAGSVVPFCLGEIYLDTTAHKTYIADGPLNTNWYVLN